MFYSYLYTTNHSTPDNSNTLQSHIIIRITMITSGVKEKKKACRGK